MKNIFFSCICLFFIFHQAYAYDFSAVAPSGQTLYYNINGSNAVVTCPGIPGNICWSEYTKPTGALTIPSSVTYGGTTYTVNSIGAWALYSCNELTSVNIPNTVTTIVTVNTPLNI